MDRPVAYRILATVLEKYGAREFAELASTIGKTQSEEILDASRVLYAIDITVSWSDSTHRDLVIHGRIDDHNTFRFSSLEEKIMVRNPDFVKK